MEKKAKKISVRLLALLRYNIAATQWNETHFLVCQNNPHSILSLSTIMNCPKPASPNTSCPAHLTQIVSSARAHFDVCSLDWRSTNDTPSRWPCWCPSRFVCTCHVSSWDRLVRSTLWLQVGEGVGDKQLHLCAGMALGCTLILRIFALSCREPYFLPGFL